MLFAKNIYITYTSKPRLHGAHVVQTKVITFHSMADSDSDFISSDDDEESPRVSKLVATYHKSHNPLHCPFCANKTKFSDIDALKKHASATRKCVYKYYSNTSLVAHVLPICICQRYHISGVTCTRLCSNRGAHQALAKSFMKQSASSGGTRIANSGATNAPQDRLNTPQHKPNLEVTGARLGEKSF